MRLAPERLLEILGQAAKEISEEFRRQNSGLPWARIIGLRNVLAHEYGEIKDEKIYLVAARDILPLIDQSKQILKENPKA